jgi:uncharacterized protein
MTELSGEQVLLRIFMGESDRMGNKPLYQFLVEMLRKDKIAGATVIRGISGFGARSTLHTANILRLSQDLPIIIEVVETAENINRVLPEIEKNIGDGLITMEKVRVIRYGVKKESLPKE